MAALLGTTVSAQAAATASTPGWRQVFSHHYGPAAGFSGFTTAVAFSKSNVWALGGSDLGGATTSQPVAEHWNGSAWSASKLPAGTTGTIISASGPAPNDIWAITEDGGWILHYNGSGWKVAKHLTGIPASMDPLSTGIVALSAKDVWAFGASGAGPGWGTWHFNGSTWHHETTVAAGDGITFGSAVSASNIWANGSGVTAGRTVEHYNGHAWTTVTNSTLSNLFITGVHAFTASSVWISADSATGSSGYLVHYSGHWSKVLVPWGLQVFGPVVSDGHGGLWFTGITGFGSTDKNYEVHWLPGNKWQRVLIPVHLADYGIAAAIPGTTSVMAGGSLNLTQGAKAVIWAYGQI